MGDGEKAPLRLQFNPKVRLESTVLPSPPTPDCWPSESLMTPWT